jgi:hypothetical protein
MAVMLNPGDRYAVRSHATIALTGGKETITFPDKEAIIVVLYFSDVERNLADSLLAWSYDFNEMKIPRGVIRERRRVEEFIFSSSAETGCCSSGYLTNVAEQ